MLAPGAPALLVVVLLLAAASAPEGPCDIFARGGTPCVAAHSLTRSLFANYSGPLYLVARLHDNATLPVHAVAGVADVGPQDTFCGTRTAPQLATVGGCCSSTPQPCPTTAGRTYCISDPASGQCDKPMPHPKCPPCPAGATPCPPPPNCTVLRIYDQSLHGNHLDLAPSNNAGTAHDHGVAAAREPLLLGGRDVYGAYFEENRGMGYRTDATRPATGVATGDEPEMIYMVTSGRHYNGGCCFDYGNAEIDPLFGHNYGRGNMEAIYWGNSSAHHWSHGSGAGPWVMADLELGLWAGDAKRVPENTPIVADFVTAMLKGWAGGFALKGGDANLASGLKTLYDGPRPPGCKFSLLQLHLHRLRHHDPRLCLFDVTCVCFLACLLVLGA